MQRLSATRKSSTRLPARIRTARAGSPAASRRSARAAAVDPVRLTVQRYAEEAEEYLRCWSGPYRRPPLLGELTRHLPRGARILDLGCGPGQDARWLRRRGYEVVGLDLCAPLLRAARRRDARVPYVLADLRRLPLRAGRFDAVWAAASLIHLPPGDVARACRSLHDVLRPGGLLAATLLHGRRRGIERGPWIPGRFIARWQRGRLVRILRAGGWRVLSLRTVINRERRGRWLNVVAIHAGGPWETGSLLPDGGQRRYK